MIGGNVEIFGKLIEASVRAQAFESVERRVFWQKGHSAANDLGDRP